MSFLPLSLFLPSTCSFGWLVGWLVFNQGENLLQKPPAGILKSLTGQNKVTWTLPSSQGGWESNPACSFSRKEGRPRDSQLLGIHMMEIDNHHVFQFQLQNLSSSMATKHTCPRRAMKTRPPLSSPCPPSRVRKSPRPRLLRRGLTVATQVKEAQCPACTGCEIEQVPRFQLVNS